MGNINKVLFIGSKKLGLNCLKAIRTVSENTISGVLTIDDSMDPRSVLQEYITYCKENNIKLSIAKNRKDSEQIIVYENPELCLVICWYWLFTKTILETVPFGFIGLHNSLLPKYRGGSPLVWNIINGEETVGFSLFSFTERMDDGVIWHQYKYNPDPNSNISTILDHLEEAAA
ncbi:MAG: formyltransferase family protein, partial [Daejeonella sp.]|nr:formyltransferase family protein [Daejeonella sp.]